MSFDTIAKVSLTIDQLVDLVDQLSDDDCRKLAAKLDERTIRTTTEKVRTRIHGEERAAKGH